MIPAISDHFIERARERANWLLKLDNLDKAIKAGDYIEPPRNIYTAIRDAKSRTRYLRVPSENPFREALILVICDDKLVTVYPADKIDEATL